MDRFAQNIVYIGQVDPDYKLTVVSLCTPGDNSKTHLGGLRPAVTVASAVCSDCIKSLLMPCSSSQAMALQKAALEEEVQIHQIKMDSSSTSFSTAALWAPAFVDKLRREHGIAAVKGYLVLLCGLVQGRSM